jgi:hypothetical protein
MPQLMFLQANILFFASTVNLDSNPAIYRANYVFNEHQFLMISLKVNRSDFFDIILFREFFFHDNGFCNIWSSYCKVKKIRKSKINRLNIVHQIYT